MSLPIIKMGRVYKSYVCEGTCVDALRGIDLEVNKGDFVAVTGPSGSGKSTLMNLLGCLDIPDEGTYKLEGHDVTQLERSALARIRNRLFGFVFQNFGLLPRTNALENVEAPLLYAGVKQKQRQARAKALLARMGLEDRLSHLPNQLSGGQQQRVAIARALANKPAVLLADEPTGNLDSKTGEQIMQLIEELNKNEGLTIVLITHEASVASRAPRQLRLCDGNLEELSA